MSADPRMVGPPTDANVGIACGACGIVVLDIDAKHGADPDEVIPELGLETIRSRS